MRNLTKILTLSESDLKRYMESDEGKREITEKIWRFVKKKGLQTKCKAISVATENKYSKKTGNLLVQEGDVWCYKFLSRQRSKTLNELLKEPD